MDTKELLEQRGNQYGDYSDNARVMQELKGILRSGVNWHQLPDVAKETLDCLCLKMGRIVNGSWTVEDNWKDILGYTQLVVDRLPKSAKEPSRKESTPDVYLILAELWGCSRTVAKERALQWMRQSPEPGVPGTPADGGHYANQENKAAGTYLRRRDNLYVKFNNLPEDDQVFYMNAQMGPGGRMAIRCSHFGLEPSVNPSKGSYLTRNGRTVDIFLWGQRGAEGHLKPLSSELSSLSPFPSAVHIKYDSVGLSDKGPEFDLMGKT